ncbi:hypothetical protein GUITHDRAFT_132954 [Guillardia theta CCMP2712]|uniref:Right handed beta helix domain-containing protein n=1 Tax=Guillardia theta (strain CCMP2712) TaxID=905079 RepID=L1JXV6_GUITC|nr:hypothetical protein GUITHDRAFT_132954 [Guillardia theta CCMP2712]EKX53192.1 hypothetical protein GUITHDRAFT_132954 [Guillardia theta CCMP2712]|eukprot:XP_005840172.1 hypothetical protein GUITHDRAFT_132954 [Guillardia theta CCMP2712]
MLSSACSFYLALVATVSCWGQGSDAGRIGLRGGSRLILPRITSRLRGGAQEITIPKDYAYLSQMEDECIEFHIEDGNHTVGPEAYDELMATFNLSSTVRVYGTREAMMWGTLDLNGAGGTFEGMKLVDLAVPGEGVELQSLGDNCICVEEGEWRFTDCEIQCSGTAMRVANEATATWLAVSQMMERCFTGGSDLSKPPPINLTELGLEISAMQFLLEQGHRNKTTGYPITEHTSMPRYAVTAWDRAKVNILSCTIQNMSYNGICCLENSTFWIENCSITGSGMSGVFMESACNVTLIGCYLADNYACLTVWGGLSEERYALTGPYSSDSDLELVVEPECTLTAFNNRLSGMIWAGRQRPKHFVEDNNEIEDEIIPSEDEGPLQGLPEVPFMNFEGGENKTLWTIDEPIPMPRWARKDRPGGDGVYMWDPQDQKTEDETKQVFRDLKLRDGDYEKVAKAIESYNIKNKRSKKSLSSDPPPGEFED